MLKTKEEHLEEVQKKEQLVQAGKNQIMEEYKKNHKTYTHEEVREMMRIWDEEDEEV